jgi:hypothetical protein
MVFIRPNKKTILKGSNMTKEKWADLWEKSVVHHVVGKEFSNVENWESNKKSLLEVIKEADEAKEVYDLENDCE